MKKKLLISSFAAAVFLLSGCDSKQQEQTRQKIEQAQKAVEKKVEQTSQEAKELAQKAEDKSEKIAKSLNENVKETKETIIDESEAPIEQTKEALSQAAQKVEDTVKTQKSGQELYVACIACHGKNAEKKALNASAVIANWSQEEIFNALKGYKEGTYGGNMKGTMTGQVARLSDEQMQRLAEYITTL